MMPINIYNFHINITGYTNTWVVEATEEEIEKLAEMIRESTVRPTVTYEINNNDIDSVVTHYIDGEGNVWTKTGFSIKY